MTLHAPIPHHTNRSDTDRPPVRLVKDGDGGYATADGRWTVKPVTMGAGVTGWAGGRGWSNGHRCWQLTDTHGTAKIGFAGRPTKVVDRLYEARSIIAAADTTSTPEGPPA